MSFPFRAQVLLRMERGFDKSILAAFSVTLALVLAGCSGASIADQLPTSVGGLPAETPARPATAYEYPAVHDMPPPRATTPMTDEQQMEMEKQLTATRDRQEAREGAAKRANQAAKKKSGQTAKKTPAALGQATGSQDGAKTNP
jgi:hypothetical protein